MLSKLAKQPYDYFLFGSQSEGTTTPGLRSDIDILRPVPFMNIMQDKKNWKKGMLNLLMLDAGLPPQQYLLQIFRSDESEPLIIEAHLPNVIVEKHGNTHVVLKSDFVRKRTERVVQQLVGKFHTAGPSSSWTDDVDIVHAFGVTGDISEVQQWINRPRPGHWPPKELLEEARTCMWFLVPAGHPSSNTRDIEWRFSPNIIERKLMFSLNITQRKCYVLLKMIKKRILNAIIEKGITSFHCKTVLFYTIERTPVDFWNDQNLAQLLLLCLHTLRRMLRRRRCPHYIIGGVNLFDGKLSVNECFKLRTLVSQLTENNRQALIDELLNNVLPKAQLPESERFISNVCIRSKLTFERIQWLHIVMFALHDLTDKPMDAIIVQFEALLGKCEDKIRDGNCWENQVAREISTALLSFQASIQAAVCIQKGDSINQSIIYSFIKSLETDVASSRLKFASMMYCYGHLQSAKFILHDTEEQYRQHTVKALCRCGGYYDRYQDHIATFINKLNPNIESKFAMCVIFLAQEAHCAPPVLLFEMNKTGIEADSDVKIENIQDWLGDARVDARVFLFYLQYLTYGGLGDRPKQMSALKELENYINEHRNDREHPGGSDGREMYHRATALNLLGHCWEMEGDLRKADRLYKQSRKYKRKNNAANWHIRRLSGLFGV